MFVLADVANGPLFLAAGLLSGSFLLLAVVLIEAVVLRLMRWASFWRSLRDAFLANLASALLGLLLGCIALSAFVTPRVTLPLLVVAWLLSVLVEAAVLKRLSDYPWRRIWLVALVANTASYLLLGPLFWTVLAR